MKIALEHYIFKTFNKQSNLCQRITISIQKEYTNFKAKMIKKMI